MSKKKRAEEPEDESWMATYADAITLLLCFFVILLSVSEPKQSKFEEVKEGFMSEFTTEEVETPFTDVFEAFQSIIAENEMERDMVVEEDDEGITLEFSSSSFYESGSAQFKPEGIPILEGIALELVGFEYDKYHIEIEGHTDDVPISTPLYPSNWELSTNRATAVVRFLIERGMEPTRMKAGGYADVFPKVPNTDDYGNPIPENREINRRIVIKLLKD